MRGGTGSDAEFTRHLIGGSADNAIGESRNVGLLQRLSQGYSAKYVSTTFPETTIMKELVKHATNTLKNAWMLFSLTSLSSLNKLMTFDLVVRSRLQV